MLKWRAGLQAYGTVQWSVVHAPCFVPVRCDAPGFHTEASNKLCLPETGDEISSKAFLHRGSLAPTYLPIKQEETEQSDTEQHRSRATIRSGIIDQLVLVVVVTNSEV